MISLRGFKEFKIEKKHLICGGYTVTGGGSRSGTFENGTKYCFTYTSDCTVTDQGITTTRFCGRSDC